MTSPRRLSETVGGLPLAQPMLWAALFGGTQTAPVGYRYYFDNRERSDPRWFVQSSLSGSIDVALNGRTYAAPTGAMTLLRYSENSQYGQREPLTQPYRNRWIALDGAGLDDHLASIRDATGPVLQLGLDHPLHDQLAGLVGLLDPQRSIDATRVAATVHQFVMALVDFATSSRRGQQTPVDRAIDHLLEHALEPIDTQAVAARYGVSREHLCRVFRQRTAQSPARYLDGRRVDHALALINATDLALEDVARQSGLRSARHLADRVRARLGRPPSDLRRRV
ncbi:MAG: AraC family transcriptional regulator [Planctomycetota bacterium]